MLRHLTILALLLLAGLVSVPAAVAEEEDQRVILRSVRPCPEVKFLGDSGEAVQWIGRSSRGFLGVEPTALTPELRRHFGVPENAGVLIARIVDDSAAAAAGLVVGDIVTRIDGEEITSPNGLGRAVRQKDGGAEIQVEYWRDGGRHDVTVTLGEHERCGIDIGHPQLLELKELGKLGEMGFTLSEEALEKLQAVEWKEALQSLKDVDWEKHFEGVRVLDVEKMEERMDRVRERLERLETSLEREHERLQRLEERREERSREREERRERETREREERERSRSESGSV